MSAPKPTPAALIIAWCRDHGIDEPKREYKFCPHRDWKVDFAWVRHLIALEIEGGVWTGGRHVSPAGFLDDLQKYNELSLRGWRLLRATPDQVRDESALWLLWRALK